jgi:hypothetical protein
VGRAEPNGAVPPDRSPEPGRRVARLTADRQAVADWLHACPRETGVRARTGVDWLPRFPILAARGLAVHVVNARHAKHVPGREPASADCQWRQNLQLCGRRNRSCRPTDDLGVVRSAWRQRDTRISAAATCLQPRHKALTAMHVHRANVRRDISGVDFTRIDGIAVLTDPPRIAEIGLALSQWHSATHGASGLSCCPDNRISGGHGLTRGTRDVVTRAPQAGHLSAAPRSAEIAVDGRPHRGDRHGGPAVAPW